MAATLTPTMIKVPLAGQIAEVEREIVMRRQVYGRKVQERRMRPAEADLLIARMEAVLKTLRWLEANETQVRAFVDQQQAGRQQ